MGAQPQPLDPTLAGFGLRRWPVERRATVEPIDLDPDRARFRRAAPAQYRRRPFDRDAAQIGGDPYVRAQSHQLQRPATVAAAVSALSRRGVTSFDGGRPWARSKSRSAVLVAALGSPSAFIT